MADLPAGLRDREPTPTMEGVTNPLQLRLLNISAQMHQPIMAWYQLSFKQADWCCYIGAESMADRHNVITNVMTL